jgi:hypothetical protein
MALTLGYVFILAALIMIGWLLGLIIGLVGLFFMIGVVNMLLTALIWNVDTKTNGRDIIAHGFALGIILLVAHLPSYAVINIMPNLILAAILFIVNCFLDGFLAKRVSVYWEDMPLDVDETV